MIGRPPPPTWEAVEEAVANGLRDVGLAELRPRSDGRPGYASRARLDVARAHHTAATLVWSLHGLPFPDWDEWIAWQKSGPVVGRQRMWWHLQMDEALALDPVSGGR